MNESYTSFLCQLVSCSHLFCACLKTLCFDASELSAHLQRL